MIAIGRISISIWFLNKYFKSTKEDLKHSVEITYVSKDFLINYLTNLHNCGNASLTEEMMQRRYMSFGSWRERFQHNTHK